MVEVHSCIVAHGIGDISHGSDEGLPLVSHPDNGEIDPDQGRGYASEEQIECILSACGVENVARSQNVCECRYVND